MRKNNNKASVLRSFCMFAAAAFVLQARADLTPLDSVDLQAVSGQGGADMSLMLQLNQSATGAYTCGGAGQTPLINCRLGISLNNRNDDGTVTGSASGKKLWVVMKGVQGTMNIQKVGLDGADVTFGSTTKAAIQLTFDPLAPILIRNFGFGSLSVQTDTVANEGASNVPGYLWSQSGTGASASTRDDYTSGLYTAAGFDSGRETGFMGLNINGNLALSGTIKVFSCDATHPRC